MEGFEGLWDILNALFGVAWFIVGGVILFRSNLQCIQIGAPYVVYALIMWLLMAIEILRGSNAEKQQQTIVVVTAWAKFEFLIII